MALLEWRIFWDEVRGSVIFFSVISLLSSFVLFAHYYRHLSVRRTPGWLIMRATIFEALNSFLFILLFIFGSVEMPRVGPLKDDPHTFRWFFLLCIASFEVCANAWRVVMFLNLLTIYRNPFNPERHRKFYIISVTLSGFITLGAVSCTSAVKKDSQELGLAEFFVFTLGFMFFPFVLFVVVGGILQLLVRYMIHSALKEREGTHHKSVSFFARRRIMKHGLEYLKLHGIQLAAGLILSCLVIFTRLRPYRALWHCLVALTCGRPTLSLLIWGLVNDVFSVSRPSFSRSTMPSTPAHPQMEVEIGAHAAANNTEARAISNEARAAQTSVQQPISLPPGPVEESNFKKELRFDLIYDVCRSIGKMAHDELMHMTEDNEPTRQAPAKASRSMEFATAGSPLIDGPDDTARIGGSFAARPLAAPVRDHDVGEEPAMTSTRTFVPQKYRAEHYEAGKFRAIRKAFGISSATFARAFPNDLTQLDPQWKQKLKESVSEGASGSFFYRVLSHATGAATSRFIVKQVNMSEVNTLLKILPDYERHVVERKGRSMIQYFSCHSIPLRWKYAMKVHFCVMRNFLPVQMWLTFDLKGATANRRALQLQDLHNKTGGTPKSRYGTLRDWEWMDIAMGVDVTKDEKESLGKIIAADCRFLEEQSLLDYSLLVGIHRLDTDLDFHTREKRLLELKNMGGYPSVDRQKVYFFGIIDVLERYSLKWRAQHAILTGVYYLSCKGQKADGISAMAPTDYSDRFCTWMFREMLQLSSDDSVDEKQARCLCCACLTRRGAQRGLARWGKLWKRRRRGLVTECIEGERADYNRRIGELEHQLKEVIAAKQARARASNASPGATSPPQSPGFSDPAQMRRQALA